MNSNSYYLPPPPPTSSTTRRESTNDSHEQHENAIHSFSKKSKDSSLVEIYKIPFIKTLFKNNVNIYGSFVREILINKMEVSEYLEQCKYIHGYCNSIYRQIIERDLHDNLLDVKVYSAISSIYNCVVYDLKILPYKPFKLILYYTKNNPLNIQKTVNIGLDINLLKINRSGLGLLYIPTIYKTSPIPLYDIIKNILTKKFIILEDSIKQTEINIKYVQSLLRAFWTNMNCSVNDIKKEDLINNEDNCGICLDLLVNKHTVQLDCKHVFHKDCWRKQINNFIQEKKYRLEQPKCPLCRKEFSIWEVLVAPYSNY